jgi:hypothetical protein
MIPWLRIVTRNMLKTAETGADHQTFPFSLRYDWAPGAVLLLGHPPTRKETERQSMAEEWAAELYENELPTSDIVSIM